jgi:uridine kinase
MSKDFIIGISGGSGSGKTSFLKALRDSFSEEEVCIISQDDYYHPKSMQEIDHNGISNFDRPSSIDLEEFHKDLNRLISGKTISRIEYTFNNDGQKPSSLTFKPAPIIIVEGIFVFYHQPIRDLLDLKIFLHAKENLKVIRRIKRDRQERNYPLEDVLYRYEHHVLPTFEKYIQPYRDQVDLVINNNKSFDKGLLVLKGFIHHHLQLRKK